MAEVELLFLVVIFEHREIDDPAEAEDILFADIQLFADADTGLAGEFRCAGCLITGEEDSIPLTHTGDLANLRNARFIEIFRDGAFGFPVLEDDVAEAACAFLAGPVVHLVEEAARPVGGARRRNRPYDSPRLNIFREQAEARAAERFRRITENDRVAQIRLVGAVFQHGIIKGDPLERGDDLAIACKFLEDIGQHRFDGIEHIFLRDEGHFDIELVKFARAAVGAGVFVAETGRDLEVAIKARHHDKLLELLRCLRQGVEFTGMHPARHQEVARALR